MQRERVWPAIGDELPAIGRPLTQEQIDRYADVSADRNPLHIDPVFAASTQFGGTIAHGMLVLARISEMLTNAFGRDWLESGRLKIRFRAPAKPGNSTDVHGSVIKIDGKRVTCEITCAGDVGEIFVDGTAEVTVS